MTDQVRGRAPGAALLPRLFVLLSALAAAGASPPALAAEELRSVFAGSVVLSADNPEGSRLAMGYADAVAVLMPRESPFIHGFEIELKSPPAALAAPNALAWEIWKQVAPEPEKNRFSYAGSRILMQVLPSRAGFVLQVPVRPDHVLKANPFSTLVPTLVEAKDFPFVFKLSSVTKGLSPELEAAQFQIRVRPLFGDEGGLRLLLKTPDGAEAKDLRILLDDRVYKPEELLERDFLLLKAGSHFLQVSSESYKESKRSFAIDKGKVLEIVLELQDTSPLVSIEAPDSAQVSLDGAKINHLAKPSFPVEPGDHVVTCKLGDYTLTRRFTAARGKSYRIVLSVELLVQEGP